jgi:AraC-like DNA-binding protein
MSDAAIEVSGLKFWRDQALPFIEARSVGDGRKVCYARHWHETFSIGLISRGRCNYVNGRKTQQASVGTVVLMNPGDVHACNPVRDEPWSYRMLYIDTAWLCETRDVVDVEGRGCFAPFAAISSTQPELYERLNGLFDRLVDAQVDSLEKESVVVSFMDLVRLRLGGKQPSAASVVPRLARAAEFIRGNRTRPLKLKDICAAAGLSPSHLIRAFKQAYGLTPHAYQLNCRIELCRSRLRAGRSLAEVALEAGFSDQAHFQRTFKRFVAATPGQYQRRLT